MNLRDYKRNPIVTTKREHAHLPTQQQEEREKKNSTKGTVVTKPTTTTPTNWPEHKQERQNFEST